MAILYRGMREDADGLPVLEDTARGLGVRPGIDVLAATDPDLVPPGAGGMSVTPDDPLHLPRHRRPPPFGGTGKDPLWVLDEADLDPALRYRSDPAAPDRHGFIEPAQALSLVEYQEAIARTRSRWRKAP